MGFHQLFKRSGELVFGILGLNLMSCHSYLDNCTTFWGNLLDKCTKLSIVEKFGNNIMEDVFKKERTNGKN